MTNRLFSYVKETYFPQHKPLSQWNETSKLIKKKTYGVKWRKLDKTNVGAQTQAITLTHPFMGTYFLNTGHSARTLSIKGTYWLERVQPEKHSVKLQNYHMLFFLCPKPHPSGKKGQKENQQHQTKWGSPSTLILHSYYTIAFSLTVASHGVRHWEITVNNTDMPLLFLAELLF